MRSNNNSYADVKSGVKVNISLDRFLKQYDRAQFTLDNTIIKDTNPYVPARDEILSKSVKTLSEIGKGELVYAGPYGRYQHEGFVMVGRAPKTETDIPLVYSKVVHSLAGPHWFERSKAANGPKWVNIVKTIAGGSK